MCSAVVDTLSTALNMTAVRANAETSGVRQPAGRILDLIMMQSNWCQRLQKAGHRVSLDGRRIGWATADDGYAQTDNSPRGV